MNTAGRTNLTGIFHTTDTAGRSKWFAVAVLLLLLTAFAPGMAQEPPASPVPVLTDVQRLQGQLRYKDYQIAQLQLDAAKGELLRYLAVLQRDGFDLDLNTWTYAPKPKAEETK